MPNIIGNWDSFDRSSHYGRKLVEETCEVFSQIDCSAEDFMKAQYITMPRDIVDRQESPQISGRLTTKELVAFGSVLLMGSGIIYTFMDVITRAYQH